MNKIDNMEAEKVTQIPPEEITNALKNERKIEKDTDGKPITFSERCG